MQPWPERADNDDDDPNGAWRTLAAARDGDRAAFETLYNQYLPTVYRCIYYRVGGNVGLAEELTSETFLRALRGLSTVTYRAGRDPRAWFLTIARNIVRDHHKSARRRREILVATPGSNNRSADDPGETAVGTLHIAELLAGLPPDQRLCLVHRVLEDLSVADTAAAMGRSVGAVKALNRRALQRLAGLFDRPSP